MTHAILFLPEIVTLTTAALVFICIAVAVSRENTWRLAMVGGAAMIGACVYTLDAVGEPFAPGIYRVDLFSQIMKTALACGHLMVLALARHPLTIRKGTRQEYSLLLLLSTTGMMMLVSATELITLYLALELSAFPLYILVTLHRETRMAGEGAAKYMLQGIFASATSLYGMSYLFGLSGSTYLPDIMAALPQLGANPLFWIAVVLTLAGFLFKLALFPFHFWAPDVYETAAHPVVAFIASASKIAAIAALCRIISFLAPESIVESNDTFRHVLLWLSIVAMTLGNLAAIVQNDIKRLLGYSAVAHAGYLIVGLQTLSDLGLAASLFYAIGYFAMSYLCFLVICEVARDRDRVPMEAVAGLWRRSPFLSLCLLIGIFGLTGLPPTVGFIGKWFLFSAALEKGQFLLVLIAAVNSVVGLYYYLRVVKTAYLEPSTEEPIRSEPITIVCACVAAVAVLWMGTAPGPFWSLAVKAAESLSGQ